MKGLHYLYIILIIGAISLHSCEDPIDVELEDAETLVTVDGWINGNPESQTIRLTSSQPYFNSSFASGINNATVKVIRGDGQVFDFTGDGDGNYVWSSTDGATLGEVDDEFKLEIDVNGDILTSETKLNRVPVVDSIYQEFVTDMGLIDGIMVEILTRDLPGVGDTYWIKTFKNGVYLNKAEEINIAYDAGFDSGAESDGFVFIPPIRFLLNPLEDDNPADSIDIPSYVSGDQVRVEIHSISNDAFIFMETMRDQLLNSDNGIFAEPLANTRGNITASSGKTVLGVFNVAAISAEERIID